MAVGPEGDIYPCMRYYDYSLNHRSGYIVGNVREGIDMEKVRPFGTLMYKLQSDEECLNCDVATGCSFCQGFNYDEADTDTNFQRAKYICKMHKARVRANDYYFAKLLNTKGIKREKAPLRRKEFLFMLSDDCIGFCSCGNLYGGGKQTMKKETMIKGLSYTRTNFMKPVFLHSRTQNDYCYMKEFDEYEILHIIPACRYQEAKKYKEYILVFEGSDLYDMVLHQEKIILNIESSEISKLSGWVEQSFSIADRINLNIIGMLDDERLKLYEAQLELVKEMIVNLFKQKGKMKELNVLTDILFMEEHGNCGAGDKLLAYGLDGNIYLCPHFYKDGEHVGNIEDGVLIKNSQLYTKDFFPLCLSCDAYQCENCIYTNKKYTREVNVSPSFQCKKSHVERRVAYKLQQALDKKMGFNHILKEITYDDPYDNLNVAGKDIGYYKTEPVNYNL